MIVDGLHLVDAALIAAAGYGTFVLRHGAQPPSAAQTTLLITAPIVTVQALHLLGFYKRLRAFDPVHCLRIAVAGTGIAVFILFTLGYVAKVTQEYSRLWAVAWAVAAPVLLVAARMVIGAWLRRKDKAGWLRRRVILIGAEPLLSALAQRLSAQQSEKIDIAASVRIEEEADIAAGLTLLDDACAVRMPDDVVLAVPGARLDLVRAIVPRIGHYWANIDICPDHALIGLPFHDGRTLGGVPVLRLRARPFEGWQGVAKWIEDRLLSALLLLLAAPVMAVIAVAIRLDSPGPVLFRQRRYGFANQEFIVYKFRTMIDRAEDEGVPQARRGDPRVTRVGRVLRRSSLDELPQLFNVLNGSMSLVGPRPHAVAHGSRFAPMVEDYLARHRIKPGMTGWAQVNGYRGEVAGAEDMGKRVEYDLAYIENWSIWLDASILLRTVVVSFRDDRAY